MIRRFILVISLLIVILVWRNTQAQTLSQTAEISIIPNTPVAGSTFTAQVESFDIDLSTATISWRYGNTVVASGIGARTITLVAPKTGEAQSLYVSVRGIEGSATAITTVRPGALDLIWESPNSYVPPFYKGKALPAPGATLRTVAIPFIGAPQTISFFWNYNNNAVQNQSGANKKTLILNTNNLTTENTISVEARAGSFSALQTIRIPFGNPTVLLYKKSDGFIDYTKGIQQTLTLREPGTTLRFEPFNFTIGQTVLSSFLSAITLGGVEISERALFNELPISRPETSGVDTVGVTIQSIRFPFQSIQKQFEVIF